MKSGTVRRRIILSFSAVILLMISLCVFAFIELKGIGAQAVALRTDSIPGVYLTGRLQAVSVENNSAVQQHILERDPARMQETHVLCAREEHRNHEPS